MSEVPHVPNICIHGGRVGINKTLHFFSCLITSLNTTCKCFKFCSDYCIYKNMPLPTCTDRGGFLTQGLTCTVVLGVDLNSWPPKLCSETPSVGGVHGLRVGITGVSRS